ncbi:Imm21 family immunity protein [Streptomyces chilikensis]|uniref:Imm21 family immunity protein n=1 Tax=Streptomyces chilikensis TaxID=1194079 RepID=UPI003F4CF612
MTWWRTNGESRATSSSQHRAFLRWLAAETEAGLSAATDAVLTDPAAVGEECGTWDSYGSAVLMDLPKRVLT